MNIEAEAQENQKNGTLSQLAIVYGPDLLKYDFGPEHPFNVIRGALTYSLMQESGLLAAPQVQVVTPTAASDDELLTFHTKHYLEFARNACERGQGFLDGGDTPAVKGGYEAGQTIVGGSLRAVEMIMEQQTRYALVPIGGLHHGHPGRASGFCIFNDVAICIHRLRQKYGVGRIAYIDMDAHHGDGVVYGFYDDPQVLTIDFHEDGRYLFPGTGETTEMGRGLAAGTKVHLPMPPYSSDASFIYAFDELVPELLQRFRPEFIMLVAGVDAHGGDPLSDMNYSRESYLHAVRSLKQAAAEYCDNRLIVWGAGGYNPASCAIRWTEIGATLADYALPDAVPASWRAHYKTVTGEDAPLQFAEMPTTDNTIARVRNMVDWLRIRAMV
jgi:acetoin utilization protein AcuC